jgi:hypothetical protein
MGTTYFSPLRNTLNNMSSYRTPQQRHCVRFIEELPIRHFALIDKNVLHRDAELEDFSEHKISCRRGSVARA